MNLTILGLGLAVMGVSIGEGILVANIAKAAARQPEMFSKLQTLMFTGVAFIEGTFFVLFDSTFQHFYISSLLIIFKYVLI